MLQRIRDRIQGWIAGVIIVLVGLAFVLWGVDRYIEGGSGDTAEVAKVDGIKITEKQVNNLAHQIEREQVAAQQGAALTPEQQQQVKEFALQNIITQTALLHAAREAGFRVNQQQVKELIEQATDFKVDGKFSPQRFQHLMYASNLTPQEFMQHLQVRMLLSQVNNGIQASAFVLPNELKKAYGLFRQRRSFGYFTVPIKRFEARVKVSDTKIKQYYEQNKEQFRTPEKVQVSYIKLSPSSIKKSVHLKPGEVKAYYEGNVDNFKFPRQWQIERVTISANGEKQQKAAAKLLSDKDFQHLMAAKMKGKQVVTEWVSAAEVNGSLANALMNMKQGQVSGVIVMPSGVSVVRVLQVKPPQVKPFSQVEATIKKALIHQKVQRKLTAKSQQLSNLSYTDPTTLKPAADALKLPIETSPLITKQGAEKGLFANKQVLSAVFSNDVHEQGNNSAPIELKNGNLIVLRIAKKEPSKLLSLDEQHQKIKSMLQKQIAKREAGLAAYEIQTALAKGMKLSEIAKKYKVVWTSKKSIRRDNKSISQQIMQTVFANAPSDTDGVGGANSVLLPNGNYAVIKITGVTTAELSKAPSKERKRLLSDLEQMQSQLDYDFYVKSVLKTSKVSKNKKALQDLNS